MFVVNDDCNAKMISSTATALYSADLDEYVNIMVKEIVEDLPNIHRICEKYVDMANEEIHKRNEEHKED